MSELPKVYVVEGILVALKDEKTQRFRFFNVEEREEMAHRCNCHDDLLAAVKLARFNEHKRWDEIKEVLDKAIVKVHKQGS